MGMTDRQFDSYQALMLELLEEAYDEIKEKGESAKLLKMIEKIRADLRRP